MVGMVVVGLDLAGVETRPTGLCVLDGLNAKTCHVFTDKELLEKTLEAKPAVIGIDAPLSLPTGRESLEDRSGPHLRECDKELLKAHIKFFPVTLGPMRKLTARGIRLRKILEPKGFTVLEVYPGGAQDVFGIARKQKGLEKLRAGLENLGITGLDSKMSDHELDAVTCAFVCKLFLEGKCVVYGTDMQSIIMPKK
jgi:predicted nuclease with RNAse H fold